MKRIVSISLGSSSRDHYAETEFCGQRFELRRIGADGDKALAVEMLKRLDGMVDVFGLGGTDLYISAGTRRYTFRESAAIAKAAVLTPIVDGSGLKNTLERRIVRQLAETETIDFTDKKVLMVCGVDRFGMAEALAERTRAFVCGDLLFGLGLPVPITKLRTLDRLARMIAPVVTRLPIRWFYPTGAKQQENNPRFTEYFAWADIIAGDFHFIRRFMPEELQGKIVLTNTVTVADIQLLRQRGVRLLVTTTPELQGRSFGTNVLEAVVVALAGKQPDTLTEQDYEDILDQMNLRPRVVELT